MTVFQIIVVVFGTLALVLLFENKLLGLAVGIGYGALMYIGGKRHKKSF